MSGAKSWARPENKRAYIREGYQLNVIVYRAVREIANAIADLTLEVHENGKYLEEGHAALKLMASPNPAQGGDTFLKEALTNYVLLGEMAIVGQPQPRPVELWNLNPLHIEIEPGAGGLPRRYIHKVNNSKTIFEVDANDRSELFFLKTYNPDDYWRGQSPLMAAGLAADTHNAGVKWNYSLLANMARPSGIIKFSGVPDEGAVSRLREWFKRAYQGAENAGQIPVLVDGAEWQAIDQTAKDMDFMNTNKEMAKLVASAFGVPLPLIDNDASTFNNLEQAKERFYTDTILPMAREFLRAFGNWLLPAYGEGLSFEINLDDIAALEGVRTRHFDRMIRAKMSGVLTADEAREALGYAPLTPEQRLELDPIGAAMSGPDDIRSAAAVAYGTKVN
jgi:HK97 family phage portal protein